MTGSVLLGAREREDFSRTISPPRHGTPAWGEHPGRISLEEMTCDE